MTPDTSYREIPLTQGQVAIVYAADYEWLSQWKWCANPNHSKTKFYVTRQSAPDENGKRHPIHMHRFILGLDRGDKRVADHIDGNSLNNRRCNLRICTQGQNTQNSKKRRDGTSGYKGVTKNHKRWMSQIVVGAKYVYLGTFDTPEQAHEAYQKAALEHHGEFANFG